ncbi:hypothetical protein [Tsukamurella pulmonis]|uniref:hypothetical protein n=1 Tax=Tsukamurella pulmonis TaxID=47312 RepID=UPI001EDCA10F|nr:hypothetical protein [Tsukamurella pulmonis]
MTYGEAVGAPEYLRDPALAWVIDEFDHSFNALAIASLSRTLLDCAGRSGTRQGCGAELFRTCWTQPD